MPNSNNKNTSTSYLSTKKPALASTPITRAPEYTAPSMWDNIKMGFGASMGSRIFGFIFGDPTVKVKVDQMPAQAHGTASAPAPAPASLGPATLGPALATSKNKCSYLNDEIKLNKCDNEELNSNKCDELFRQMYKCQKNI